MNTEIRLLQENIVNCVNSARMPTEVKRLVVLEVLMKLEEQANKEIALELQNKREEQESEE